MRRLFHSLRARLTFWVLLLTSLSYVVIALVFHFYSVEREEKAAMAYARVKLDGIAYGLDRKAKAVEHSVERAVPAIEHCLATPESLITIVEQWVKADTLVMGGSIAFEPNYYPEKGRWFMPYVCLTPDSVMQRKYLGSTAYDYMHKAWYTEARRSDVGRWSEPYFDQGGGGRWMVTYALALRDDTGRAYAVVTADVALRSLTDVVAALAHDDKGQTAVFSPRGKLLTTSKLQDFTTSKLQDSTTSQLHDFIELRTTVPDLGWQLCTRTTRRDVMSELFDTSVTIVLVFVVALLLLGLAVRLILRHEMQPLEHLSEAARAVGRGQFDIALPAIHHKNELRELRDAFQKMQTSLTDYVEQLQRATAAQQRTESELRIAHTLQMSLVPRTFPPFPERDDLDLYATLKPAKAVGGDFYDYFLSGGRLYFAVGDVSGKGIPASLFMAITRSLLRIIAATEDSPTDIVRRLNDAIATDNTTSMFVTTFVGILDLTTHQLTYCNAGHNPPYLLTSDGRVTELAVAPNLPIGVLPDYDYVSGTVSLRDAALFVYTDGVTESRSPAGELFGTARLESLLRAHCTDSAANVIQRVDKALQRHAPSEQSDDITMLMLRLQAAPHVLRTTTAEVLAQLPAFVSQLATAHRLPASATASLNLALEEAVANVVNYAYPDADDETNRPVTLTATLLPSTHVLQFVLEDHGRPFDPTAVAPPDTSQPLEARQIGGLGIHLTRSLMESVSYERRGDTNRLTMLYRL